MDTLDAARVLPKMTLERLQALFDRLSDQKGRLDARGLKAVLDMVGVNFTDSDVADLVIEMDPRNKSLDFTDFVSVIMRPLDDDVLDDLRDVFDVLDRNKRGFVDAEDLRAAMESIINTPVSLLTVRASARRVRVKSTATFPAPLTRGGPHGTSARIHSHRAWCAATVHGTCSLTARAGQRDACRVLRRGRRGGKPRDKAAARRVHARHGLQVTGPLVGRMECAERQ